MLRSFRKWFNKHFKLIAGIAVVTIPTIYTVLFLGSMWDPYGNVSSLPVAVVNNDEAVIYNDKELAVGDDLVENLKENDSLAFNFVSSEQAENGLKNGTYYMVITIPSDFSENASTLMDDNPKKMQLDYETNPGSNYIASKMSQSAIEKIKNTVAASVTESYSQTIFENISTIGDGMNDAADGSEKIYDGSVDLADGSKTVSDGIQKLADSTLTFKEGAETLEEGLVTYTNGVSSVNSGALQLTSGIGQLSAGTATLSDGAEQLLSGSKSLKNGVDAYTSGVNSAYEGAGQLDANSSSLVSGVESVSSGVSQLSSGSGAVLSGLNQVSSSIASSMSEESQNQLTQVTSGLTQLNAGIQQLNTQVQNTSISIDTSDLTNNVTSGLTNIGQSTQDAATQLQTLQSAITSLASSEAFQMLPAEEQSAIMASISTPMASLAADLQSIGDNTTSVADSFQNSGLSETAESLSATFSTLQSSVSQIATNSNVLLPGASQAITNLEGGLLDVQDALDRTGTTSSDMGLIQGMQQVSTGLSQLESGIDGEGGLSEGVSSYTQGVSTLYAGLDELAGNSSSLSSGASQLSDGITSLSGSVPTLTDAISQLKSGSMTLSDGTEELVSNNSELLSGMSQLTSGASQLHDGADTLNTGYTDLDDGIATLEDGAKTLYESVRDGADEVADISATDKTYDMMADPVEANETQITTVETNGDAMSAYMMSVALWVGGLAYCLIFQPEETIAKGRKKGYSAMKSWLSEVPRLIGIAILQAILMITMLCAVDGFNPIKSGKILLFACLAALAFMSLEYTLNMLFGKVGSYVLLVFMCLQLSGSAGTYPIELSGSFYEAINPFMPFTYTVHAFRATTSGADVSIAGDVAVLVCILIAFTLFTLAGISVKARNLELDELEEQENTRKSNKNKIAKA